MAQSGKVAMLVQTAMRVRCVMCDVQCPGLTLRAGRDASSMCDVRCLGSALKAAALSAECAMSDVQVWRCVLAAMRGRCAMLEVEVVRCEFDSETRSFQWTDDDGQRTNEEIPAHSPSVFGLSSEITIRLSSNTGESLPRRSCPGPSPGSRSRRRSPRRPRQKRPAWTSSSSCRPP